MTSGTWIRPAAPAAIRFFPLPAAVERFQVIIWKCLILSAGHNTYRKDDKHGASGKKLFHCFLFFFGCERANNNIQDQKISNPILTTIMGIRWSYLSVSHSLGILQSWYLIS